MSEGHTGFITNWKQLLAVAIAAFAVPVFLIIGVVQLITGGMQIDANTPGMSAQDVVARIKPVGEINVAGAGGSAAEPAPAAVPAGSAAPAAGAPAPAPAAAAPAATAARNGEQVFQAACVACHGAGIAGAPKLGDAAAWKARVAQGKPTLHDHAIKGIRAMPPKGGNASLPDAEVKAAVDYMVAQVK